MKKILFSFVGLSILISGAAFAESVSIATKDYVDDGLRSVYNKVKSTQNDVDELTVFVGAPSVGDEPGSGLTKRIEDLEVGLGAANNQYTGDGGVVVTNDNKIKILGLDQNTAFDSSVRVIKNNSAVPIGVADAWSMEE